jgi:vancomycin permeability regulator SanA
MHLPAPWAIVLLDTEMTLGTRKLGSSAMERRSGGSISGAVARFARTSALLGLLLALAAGVPAAWVYFTNRAPVYDDPNQVPSMPVAIVFGAGIRPDGSATPMLADRVDAAVALFRAGKVQRILMTGDNGSQGYNEVAAMRRRAIDMGVPADRVNMDYAGFRTYDSCYRAKVVFGVTKAVLVTQGYHLPRALYLANSFGIDAVGLKAGYDWYGGQYFFLARESAALFVTFYEANVTRPLPKYLGDPVDLETQNR